MPANNRRINPKCDMADLDRFNTKERRHNKVVKALYLTSPDLFDAVYTPRTRTEIRSLIDVNDEVTDLGKVATDDQVEFFRADSYLLQNSLQVSLLKVQLKADR